jgi:hypothetical protein
VFSLFCSPIVFLSEPGLAEQIQITFWEFLNSENDQPVAVRQRVSSVWAFGSDIFLHSSLGAVFITSNFI